MKIEELIENLPDNFSIVDREMVTRAYRFAENAHKNQKRASGEPYVVHCLAVAGILVELRLPPPVIIAALLHDTVEDTPVTLEEIKREFGDEVALLVDGVTKLSKLPTVSPDEGPILMDGDGAKTAPTAAAVSESPRTAKKDREIQREKDARNENLRKTFMAMGNDIRVVIIKLADRLHNMRTLSYIPEPRRSRIAQETLDIYAPLANRLGIWRIKWELEDLGFRYTSPDRYKEIVENLAERRTERETQVQKIIERLKALMEQSGVKAEISGRPKHIYSIYRKMLDKGKTFDMVRDLRGVRLIVPEKQDCYAALGIIHGQWRPIPMEFDDYIAAPKDNDYQSLHTAVIYDDGKPLEVQIRTPEMNQHAEFGIASHWRYKERSSKSDQAYEQRINWLRQMMEWYKDVEDAQEFIDGMRTDIFEDRVYVFTPRGDIIDLPAGSTPIDFAYQVHTEIGNRCRGAKINGKLVSLDYCLKTGDQVEILTAKHGGPSRDWLNTNLGLVKTPRAQGKIRQWFKRQDREQNLAQGRAMLDRELRRLGLNNVDLEKLAFSLDIHNVEELYVALGCGDLSIGRIIAKLTDLEKNSPDPLLKPSLPIEQKSSHSAVSVLGLKGLLTVFARCCNPVPGDEIVGYITRGRGATIHRSDCPNILRLTDRERIVKVSWGENQRTYPIRLEIKAYDRQDLVGDIYHILTNESINLVGINLKVTDNLASIYLSVEVGDITQLSRILARIENLPNVLEAHRVHAG